MNLGPIQEPKIARNMPISVPIRSIAVYAVGALAVALLIIGGCTPQILPDPILADRLTVALAIFSTIFALIVVIRLRHTVHRLLASEAMAKQVAGHDSLSGLPNRMLFSELIETEISRCKRRMSQFALFYLDLDKFKETNDRFGHAAGDRMIVAVTQRIQEVLRSGDRIARIGGDEFAILQSDVTEPRDCAMLAYRILDTMSRPFNLGEEQVFSGISIGIALYPQNAADRQSLMQLADLALYRAKHQGRNQFTFFEAKMGEAQRLRKTVEDELRLAIENDELVIIYQPIVSSLDERMVGVEALVRWPHPTQGYLSPDSFISLAEDRGLIVPLGEWALKRACLDAKRWPGLRVAVNVSPVQFRHKGFVGTVERILESTGMDPSHLELELTEGVIISDADLAERSVIDLRAMGISMALDDFGNGYSSLIYLRRFAFDRIKIDRSFLQSMEPTGESAIIVESIVHLGRALGLRVTAEGIETVEQAAFLRSLGCDELQGYLYSEPVSVEEIDRRFAASHRVAAPEQLARSVA
jgi:diguanylate cyclase (GGDEF)-like protein